MSKVIKAALAHRSATELPGGELSEEKMPEEVLVALKRVRDTIGKLSSRTPRELSLALVDVESAVNAPLDNPEWYLLIEDKEGQPIAFSVPNNCGNRDVAVLTDYLENALPSIDKVERRRIIEQLQSRMREQ